MSATHSEAPFNRDWMVDKVYKDMYHGNGKPAITIRIQTVEDRMANIEKLLSKLIWLGMGTLAGTLGSIAIELFKVVLK